MNIECNKSDLSVKDSSVKRPPSEEEICAFCLDAKRDPVQLKCKHSYCRSCLELYCQARSWEAKLCPLCRCILRPLLNERSIVSCSAKSNPYYTLNPLGLAHGDHTVGGTSYTQLWTILLPAKLLVASDDVF